MKKITALMILFSLLLTSCGSENPESADTTPDATTPEETTVQDGDGLPDVKFDGWELKILNYTEDSLTWCNTRIIVEEQTGDILDDAIYERNATLEERFNFRFAVDEDGQNEVAEKIKQNVLAGDNSYYIYAMGEGSSSGFIPYTLDWNNIPYLKLDEAWWNPAATSVYEIAGKQTALAGNMTLSAASRAVCTVFNKRIWDELGDRSDLYELVRSGKWTVDKFLSIAKSTNKDMNGNSEWDADDIYGLMFGRGFKGYIASFLCGSGMNFTEKNENGENEFTLYKNERGLDLVTKLVDAWSIGNGYEYNKADSLHNATPANFFENGHALFSQRVPHDIYKLRAMEDDIGILPIPKYDEAQENYCSAAWGGAVWTLSKTFDLADAEKLGVILEAMSYYSYENIIPVYKEVALKTKTARDNESADMLDIIFDTIYFDFGTNIMYDAIFVPTFLNDIFTSKSSTAIVSSMEKAREKITEYQTEIFTAAEEME